MNPVQSLSPAAISCMLRDSCSSSVKLDFSDFSSSSSQPLSPRSLDAAYEFFLSPAAAAPGVFPPAIRLPRLSYEFSLPNRDFHSPRGFFHFLQENPAAFKQHKEILHAAGNNEKNNRNASGFLSSAADFALQKISCGAPKEIMEKLRNFRENQEKMRKNEENKRKRNIQEDQQEENKKRSKSDGCEDEEALAGNELGEDEKIPQPEDSSAPAAQAASDSGSDSDIFS